MSLRPSHHSPAPGVSLPQPACHHRAHPGWTPSKGGGGHLGAGLPPPSPFHAQWLRMGKLETQIRKRTMGTTQGLVVWFFFSCTKWWQLTYLPWLCHVRYTEPVSHFQFFAQIVSKSTHQELEKLNTFLSLFEDIKEILRQPQLEGDSKQKGTL